jgi:hypothetical protein
MGLSSVLFRRLTVKTLNQNAISIHSCDAEGRSCFERQLPDAQIFTQQKLARVTPFKDRNDLIGVCEQVAQIACLCLFSFCTAYITRYTPTQATSEPRSLTVTRWRPK